MRWNVIMEKKSVIKAHHSTDTALLRVYKDVMFNIYSITDSALTSYLDGRQQCVQIEG